jgi:hypothetical protein
MALTPVLTLDLNLHGMPGTFTSDLIDSANTGAWTLNGSAVNIGATAPLGVASTVSFTKATGLFTINVDKFTVDHANGNTNVAGNLSVTGILSAGAVTYTGALQVNNNIGGNVAPTYGLHLLGGQVRIQALATPAAPTVTPVGTTGSTAYNYYIVAKDRNGGRTLVSPVGSTATGNATLNGTNYNTITWTAVPGAYSYDVLKGTTGTSVATDVLVTTYNDQGGATSAYTAPTVNNTADVTIDGKLTVQGDMVVNGTTTYVNSTNLEVNDKFIHLNQPMTEGANDPVPTGYSGLSIHRGTVASVDRDHAGLIWEEAASKWHLAFITSNDGTIGSYNALKVGGLEATTGAFSSTLSAAGDFSVNTNKFTVNATSGNTLVAGTLDVTSNLAVNTNKFTVNATNGNTVVAGTLSVAGITTLQSGLVVKTRTVTTATDTATTGDLLVFTNRSAAGACTVTLPTAPADGTVVWVKDDKGDAATYQVTIAAGGSDTIEGAASEIIYNNNGWRQLVYKAATTAWKLMAREPKVQYSKFIDRPHANGITTLAKDASQPPIPDDDTTAAYFDGRKVRRSSGGTDRIFEVVAGGGSINFAGIRPNEDVELNWWR